MGYYSDVALCLTKNGMDQLKTALAEAEKNNPDNFAVIKMLIGGEPNKIDEGSGSVVFLWEGEKWYDEFDEIAFVGEFMDNLPMKTSCSSVLAKIMTTLKLAVVIGAIRSGCELPGKLQRTEFHWLMSNLMS